MGERDERFNAVLAHFVEHLIIELQSLFIRLGIITVRENTRPVDRHAEHLEAKLAEQSDILLEPVVKINPVPLRITFRCLMLHCPLN
ncbi:hypothetical protein D3C73_1296620 [compost metagenome]